MIDGFVTAVQVDRDVAGQCADAGIVGGGSECAVDRDVGGGDVAALMFDLCLKEQEVPVRRFGADFAQVGHGVFPVGGIRERQRDGLRDLVVPCVGTGGLGECAVCPERHRQEAE